MIQQKGPIALKTINNENLDKIFKPADLQRAYYSFLYAFISLTRLVKTASSKICFMQRHPFKPKTWRLPVCHIGSKDIPRIKKFKLIVTLPAIPASYMETNQPEIIPLVMQYGPLVKKISGSRFKGVVLQKKKGINN